MTGCFVAAQLTVESRVITLRAVIASSASKRGIQPTGGNETVSGNSDSNGAHIFRCVVKSATQDASGRGSHCYCGMYASQQQTRWSEPRGTDHLQTLQSHVESQSRREPWPQLQTWTPPRFVRCALYRTHWLHLVGQNIRGQMNIKLAKNELSSNIHLP